ncbi:MAG: adenine methyltransferase [Nitrospira sp. HN-bin3]|uniref:site-specific DNA-methyltransferase n=1 Tax=Nitrospira cf. moscoviensis SBR1015 TaxID=96242 RepID=UPI000A0C2090|nr:site-specific DNA-methyltransferase [Nitrospira cf. moscoviensis SBR1015]OQW39154.1 MAG: adenine methyltransferase [Nitrospira sp. HN-bin3]
MKKLTANDPDSKSPDLAAGNVAKLKALFPELVTEGPEGAAVNVDLLKQLVGDKTVADAEERYGLNWHGKRAARRLALTPSTGTLRPCPEDSVDWDTTQNLMIEGDNLEVLKLLQKSYAGKVKLIYIDPPYNTGKDFVYPDNFQDNIRNYLELTGQVDGGQKMSSNTEASGRFHTDWLSMMYPRLKVARSLLRDDGIFLISIDEREYSHLRTICVEVFGEENAIGTLVWKGATDNNPTQIATEHEYLLCFGRSKEAVASVWKNSSDVAKMSLLEEYERLRANPLLDERGIQNEIRKFIKSHQESLSGITHYDRVDKKGLYTGSRKVHNPKPGGYVYDVIHPTTGKVCVPPVNGYRYPKDRMEELIAGDRILYGDDETQIIQIKEYLADYKGKLSSVIQLDSRAGANELNSLFDVQKLFSNPKPVVLLRDLFEFMLEGDDLVLDFFAGSGTTGHAVMAQNAADGGNRRYILVQLPEPLDQENKDQKVAADFCKKLKKPRNIAELTKERLRRAATKIKEENPMFSGDMGFRVFKLDSTNIREWEPKRDDLPKTLAESVEHLKADRSQADILYELLLKLGLDLCVPVEMRAIAGKEVHAIGGGVLMACLAENIGCDDIEPLGQGIVEWHKALATAGDTTCVFRDSAFADDVAKTNMAAILEQNGIATVRSL